MDIKAWQQLSFEIRVVEIETRWMSNQSCSYSYPCTKYEYVHNSRVSF